MPGLREETREVRQFGRRTAYRLGKLFPSIGLRQRIVEFPEKAVPFKLLLMRGGVSPSSYLNCALVFPPKLSRLPLVS